MFQLELVFFWKYGIGDIVWSIFVYFLFFRELLNGIVPNSSSESENEESKQNTLKINIILYNLLTKAGDCKPGQAKIKEHEDRTTFNSFIRTAQYGLFNPNRPRRTGTFF